MAINNIILQELDFVPTHNIVLEAGMPVFRETALGRELKRDTSPVVYMWLSPLGESGEFDVLYVGKAGYGINRRISQHQAGFTHSTTGRDNRRLVTEWLAAGRRIEVHRRVSSINSLFGQNVSLYSIEEQALCERYNPLWNRACFPRIHNTNIGKAAVENRRVTNTAHPLPIRQPMDPENPITFDFNFNSDYDKLKVTAFLNGLGEEKRSQFLSICQVLHRLDSEAQQKYVGHYTNQPDGYNGRSFCVFGHMGPKGRARDRIGWIPLIDNRNAPLTVIFPHEIRKPGLKDDLFSASEKGDWCPKSLSHFLANVPEYLAR